MRMVRMTVIVIMLVMMTMTATMMMMHGWMDPWIHRKGPVMHMKEREDNCQSKT